MTNREVVVDLASFQSELTVQDYKNIGATKAIVKISENTNYVNPYIRSLIDRSAGGGVNGFAFYHFGRFYNDSAAVAEANYFIANAKRYANVKPGTLLILDAEIKGMPSSSVIAFLQTLRNAGYHTGFYTYKFLLPEFNLEEIHKYADFFWLAAYPLGSQPGPRVPNFNYFPSANYVDCWQHTDNLLGYKVDGSITLTDNAIKLFNPSEVKIEAPKPTPAPSQNNVKYDSWTDDLGVKWFKEDGKFTITVDEGIVLRWGATTNSSKIGVLPKGSVVKYDAFCHSGGYVWIRQPRGNGQYGYLPTGEDRNGTRLNYWGKFTE